MKKILFWILAIVFVSNAALDTTTTPGDWDQTGTWRTSHVPGLGDTAVLLHAVLLTDDRTIGSSPANGTDYSLVIYGASGALTIDTGHILTVRGNVLNDAGGSAAIDSSVRLMPGAQLILDATATTPDTTTYYIRGGRYCKIWAAGTSANRCKIRALAPGIGLFGEVVGDAGNTFVAEYFNLERFGDATRIGLKCQTGSTTQSMRTAFNNCIFDSCGRVIIAARQAYDTVIFNDCRVNNSKYVVGAGAFTIEGKGSYTGVIQMYRSSIQRGGATFGSAGGVQVVDCYINGGIATSGSAAGYDRTFLKFQRNFVVTDDALNTFDGSAFNTYWFDNAGPLNAATCDWYSYGSRRHMQYCIVDQNGHGNLSDMIICKGGDNKLFSFRYNILVGDADNTAVGKLSNVYNDSTYYRVRNNTYITGHETAAPEVSIGVGESGTFRYTQVLEFRNNLAWTPDGQTAGLVMVRQQGDYSDYVAVDSVDYNYQCNIIQDSAYFCYTGYRTNPFFSSGTPDIHGDSGNPDFRDSLRNITTFDIACLGNATQSAWENSHAYVVGDTVSYDTSTYYYGTTINWYCIRAHTSNYGNDTNSAPGGITGTGGYWRLNWIPLSCKRLENDYTKISQLLGWVRMGFKPNNQALKGSGYQGRDIGAVPFWIHWTDTLLKTDSSFAVRCSISTELAINDTATYDSARVKLQISTNKSTWTTTDSMGSSWYPCGYIDTLRTTNDLIAETKYFFRAIFLSSAGSGSMPDTTLIDSITTDAEGGGGTAPNFTLNPSDSTVTEFDTVAFWITVTGDPVPDLQWQRKHGTWSNITGETGDTLRFESRITMNGDSVRCIATNTEGADTSTRALLTVEFIQGLEDLDARERRNRFKTGSWAVWHRDYFENATTYRWQPEMLIYHDTGTGAEVRILSNTPKLNTIYGPDIGMSPYSADGKKIIFTSLGRYTEAWDSTEQAEYITTNGAWYSVNADGSNMRPLVEAPHRAGKSTGGYLEWSPQLPGTYYQRGSTYYGSEYSLRTLYATTIDSNGVVTVVDSVQLPAGASGGSLVKTVSANGRRIIWIDESDGVQYPVTVYRDSLHLDYASGYTIDRDYGFYGNMSTTPVTSYHDQYLPSNGDWFFIMPTNTYVWWKTKTDGTSGDGGPLYTGDLGGNDFGEIWPESHRGVYWQVHLKDTVGHDWTGTITCSPSGAEVHYVTYSQVTNLLTVSINYADRLTTPAKWDTLTSGAIEGVIDSVYYANEYSPFVCEDPFNENLTSYWSHFMPDRWGRMAIFSNTADDIPPNGEYGTGIWDITNHQWVTPTFESGAQHHNWNAFSDWSVSAAGPISNDVRTELWAQIYNDTASHKRLADLHSRTYGGDSYDTDVRPGEDPDGLLASFHSDFMGGLQDKCDIFDVVINNPEPPDSIHAFDTLDGVGISWIPPRYTDRRWVVPGTDSINETTGRVLYARTVKKYNLWRTADTTGNWTLVKSIDAEYDNDSIDFTLIPKFGSAWVDALNPIRVVDTPPNGVWYYAVTTRTHSGLESTKLSAIWRVGFTSGVVDSANYNTAEGRTGYYSTAPTMGACTYVDEIPVGHYTLNWLTAGNKTRYYNIYYRPDGITPTTEQRNLVASVPYGYTAYRDWLADSGLAPSYTITAIDYWGNESDSVVVLEGEPPTGPTTYILTVTDGGNGSTDPTGEVVVDSGAATAIEATSDAHYHFLNWTVTTGTGATFADDEDSTTTVTLGDGNATIRANFGADSFYCAATGDDYAVITFLVDSLAAYGETIICTLTVSTGYVADGSWGHVGASKHVLSIVTTSDTSVTASSHARPVYTIDTVYETHAPITTSHASLAFDSASPAPSCTLFCTADNLYAAKWPGGTIFYPDRDTLIISMTQDSTVTALDYPIPIIDSIRPNPQYRLDSCTAYCRGCSDTGIIRDITTGANVQVKSWLPTQIDFYTGNRTRGWYNLQFTTSDSLRDTASLRIAVPRKTN